MLGSETNAVLISLGIPLVIRNLLTNVNAFFRVKKPIKSAACQALANAFRRNVLLTWLFDLLFKFVSLEPSPRYEDSYFLGR